MNCFRLFRMGTMALSAAAAIALNFGLGIGTALAQAPPAATAPATVPPAAATDTPTPPVPATPAPTAPLADPPTPAPPPATAQTPAINPAPTPPATAETPVSPATPAPAAPSVQTADAFGEEITLTAKAALIAKGEAKWDSAFESLTDSLKSLSALLEKQGIKPSGNSMVVYTSTDDAGFTYQAEIPVDQEPKNLPKTMSMGKTPDGKALKFVHRGSYDNMDNTYEAITNHLDDKKLEAKDTFIEEYITDPLKTSEDTLIINVYVPLK